MMDEIATQLISRLKTVIIRQTANRAIAVFLSNARVDLGEDVGGAHPLT